MAKNIKVLLLEDVASLGKAGDIVAVLEGYARNALFPQGKAAMATADVQKKQEAKQVKKRQEKEATLQELQSRASTLDNTELTLPARVKDGSEIFGSITAKQIVESLNEQAHLTLYPKDIVLAEPIKQLGTYPLTVHLSPEVDFIIHVTVVPNAESVADNNDAEQSR